MWRSYLRPSCWRVNKCEFRETLNVKTHMQQMDETSEIQNKAKRRPYQEIIRRFKFISFPTVNERGLTRVIYLLTIFRKMYLFPFSLKRLISRNILCVPFLNCPSPKQLVSIGCDLQYFVCIYMVKELQQTHVVD